jgi:hypothetical protein
VEGGAPLEALPQPPSAGPTPPEKEEALGADAGAQGRLDQGRAWGRRRSGLALREVRRGGEGGAR